MLRQGARKSFWSRLKADLLDGGRFSGLKETKIEIRHYLADYHPERRHPAFGYRAPHHFHVHLQTTAQPCPA